MVIVVARVNWAANNNNRIGIITLHDLIPKIVLLFVFLGTPISFISSIFSRGI
jgi:hypothetical protein